MARSFTYIRTSGERSKVVSRSTLLLVAARRLVQGAGPFVVTRGGYYRHTDLHRGETLTRIAGMTMHVIVGERVTAKDEAGNLVFDCRREKLSIYENPLRDCAGLRGLREDQGVDYSVTQRSPVYAIGPGKLTVYRPTSGWPLDETHSSGGAYLAYMLTAGPATGKYVYDAENIELNPNLKIGAGVNVNTIVAWHRAGYANCEMGWALPSNDGYSPLAVMGYGGTTPQFHEGDRTAAGANFDSFMQALGAPAGLAEGRSIKGVNPGGYPKSWAGIV